MASLPSSIAMAVYDTEDNRRTDMTRSTLESLSRTVDLSKHKLIVSDNGSCAATQEVYSDFIAKDQQGHLVEFIYNGTNLGTAGAINKVIERREPGQSVCKVDNDVVFDQTGWMEWIDDAIEREPLIGILAMKRMDLDETARCEPTDWRYAPLFELPHEKGKPWLYIQAASHIMGTACCYAGRLLDKVGYLYQPSKYGFDDSLMCVRNKVAGFIGGFLLVSPVINHIDPGGTAFQKWKEEEAGRQFDMFHILRDQYITGKRNIYHGPNGEST